MISFCVEYENVGLRGVENSMEVTRGREAGWKEMTTKPWLVRTKSPGSTAARSFGMS